MVDIQSATAENRRGKEEKTNKERRNHRDNIVWPALLGGHNEAAICYKKVNLYYTKLQRTVMTVQILTVQIKTGNHGRAAPLFVGHVYCGQTAGSIKMPFGMEVGRCPDHIVLDRNPSPP